MIVQIFTDVTLCFKGDENKEPVVTENGGISDVSVEYVPEQLDVKDPALEAFSDVFARFQLPASEPTVRSQVSLSKSCLKFG